MKKMLLYAAIGLVIVVIIFFGTKFLISMNDEDNWYIPLLVYMLVNWFLVNPVTNRELRCLNKKKRKFKGVDFIPLYNERLLFSNKILYLLYTVSYMLIIFMAVLIYAMPVDTLMNMGMDANILLLMFIIIENAIYILFVVVRCSVGFGSIGVYRNLANEGDDGDDGGGGKLQGLMTVISYISFFIPFIRIIGNSYILQLANKKRLRRGL